MARIVLALLGLAALAVIVLSVTSSSGTAVTPTLQRVEAIGPHTVRVSIDWANAGSSPASGSCALVVDQVNAEVTSIANVPAHSHRLVSEDIGVDRAHSVTKADVALTNCS